MNYVITDGELYHYGVPGMKWGVRKAIRKSAKNERLRQKALTYDKRSSSAAKKSEKLHAERDLERSNKSAIKSAKYEKKAATLSKKAIKSDNDRDRLKLESRAAKYEYKAAVKKMEGNRLSKTAGYGVKAMKYSIKSDKMAIKAAKARKKIAENERYIEMMNRKVSSLSKEELDGAYAFTKELRKGR